MAYPRTSGRITLAGLGENALLARLLRDLPRGKDLLVGPGDDCAVIGRKRDAQWTLLKTDCVVEDVHFRSAEDPRRIGRKALCRVLSDIAAMSGEPRQALITVAAPRASRLEKLTGIYDGIRQAARAYKVGIAGGETARSPDSIIISIAMTGTVERARCVLRSGGCIGHLLYVTGRLGGSLRGKHLDFIPRLSEARWLTAHFSISAMMDLSDGLAADLPRLTAASGCGFDLLPARIPRTRGCTLAQALGDGEDYELLFAVPPETAHDLERSWKKRFPKLALTSIGALTRRDRRTDVLDHHHGFDHFA